MMLGHAGSPKTQEIFAESVKRLLTNPKNHLMLFQSAVGNEILKKLITCDATGEKQTKKLANQALRYLASNVDELIQRVVNGHIIDLDIERWVASMLFQSTISKLDESSKHTIYIFESPHPYKVGTLTQEINICGAERIIVKFDSRSITEEGSDIVGFYKTSECAEKDALPNKRVGGADKFSGADLGKAVFESDEDNFFLGLKCDDSVEGWGYKIYVSAVFPVPEQHPQENRLKIVKNNGLSLLERYIKKSGHSVTKRYAAFTLANLCMSEDCKQLILDSVGLPFFLQFPMDMISQRVAALCLSELMENEENQLKLLESERLGETLIVLKKMTMSYDEQCRFLAVKCLDLLSSPDQSTTREKLLQEGILETFFYVYEKESSKKMKNKALGGLFKLGKVHAQVLKYYRSISDKDRLLDLLPYSFNN